MLLYYISMSTTTYSASRISTFQGCKLRYALQYKKGYYAEETQQNVLTRKGIAFHTLAENYDPLWTDEQLDKFRLDLEEKYKIPEEYSLALPAKKFKRFYDNELAVCAHNGGTVLKEVEFKFTLEGHSFTGKLDVLLQYPNGEFKIVDYKTGKSSNTSYYTAQMMLYVYATAQQYNIPREEIVDRISVQLFFPLAEITGEDLLNYTKVFKKVKFSLATFDEEIEKFTTEVKNIEGVWEPEANLTKLCDWCPFIGRAQYCDLSFKSGLLPTRGVIIKQRDWAIKAGIK